jgi:hypothetical protein
MSAAPGKLRSGVLRSTETLVRVPGQLSGLVRGTRCYPKLVGDSGNFCGLQAALSVATTGSSLIEVFGGTETLVRVPGQLWPRRRCVCEGYRSGFLFSAHRMVPLDEGLWSPLVVILAHRSAVDAKWV